MSKSIEQIYEDISNGQAIYETISELYKLEFSIVESMKLIVKGYGLSLAEAKKIVTAHPVWSDVVKVSSVMHDELINKFNEENE